MKLYYFELKARSENARLMLKISGTEFENVTFSFAEWAAKYKALSPGGKAPWLVLDNGQVLTQSAAIDMYCANVTGHLPSDPLQVARTVEMVNSLEDVWSLVTPTMSIKDADEKVAARKALIADEGDMAKKMSGIESMLAAATTEYYCGDQPTLADFHIFTWVSFIRSGFLDGITAEYMDSLPKLAAHRTKVASIPKVKEMYADVAGFEP